MPRGVLIFLLDGVLAVHVDAGSKSTHVDAEGEVAWVEEYVRERLAGRGHAEATARVIHRIRTLAP